MSRIIFILLLLITNNMVAQTSGVEGQKVNVLTPNAESFKIFGDIPVSLYTGVPSIQVPIYNIQTDYINLDLGLSYHASGFKPSSHPSWVGLGWNLNIGGIITREVKYAPDELAPTDVYCGTNGSGNLSYGFYFSHKVLDKNNWYMPISDALSVNPDFNTMEFLVDRSPDIFSFNFLGYSGKFYLNHLGEWKVQSDTPLKVEFDKNDLKSMFVSSNPTFTKFTIIDEKGVKYVFGGKDAIEYTVSMQPCNYDYEKESLASSWCLTEIIPPVGEAIIFSYERGPFQSSLSCSYPEKILSRYSGNDDVANNYILKNVSGSITSPVYLTSVSIPSENLTISFKTSKSNDLNYFETNYTDFFYYKDVGAGVGVVPGYFLGFNATYGIPYFDRNPEDEKKASTFGRYRKDKFVWLKLDAISFNYSSESGITLPSKTIKLGYEENSKSRLKLTSVSTSYPNSPQDEVYTFEYNKKIGNFNNIAEPEYLSEYGDQWGYANGKYLWKEKDKKDARKSLKNACMLSVLNKVTYPSKGYTQFYYENHEYYAYVDNSMYSSSLFHVGETLAGGLRVKRIVNVDENGGYTAKEYTYRKKDQGLQSSGILHAYPAFYRISDQAILFNNSGAHIGYSSVVEKYNDGSFKSTDFITEDYFSRLGETVQSCLDDTPVYAQSWISLVPYSSRDFERGKVSDEYFCDSQGKITKSVHYNYINIGKDASNSVRTADPQYMHYLDLAALAFSGHTAYYYYTYYNKLESIREVIYNKDAGVNYGDTSKPPVNKTITSKTSFLYDKYGQKIKEIQETSKSSKKEIETKYPYTDNLSLPPLQEMVKRNMLNYPVEYKVSVSDIFQERFNFNYALFNNSRHILIESLTKEYKGGLKNTQFEYKYNSYGKLIESKSYTDLTESYLWNYKAKKVMAIISNASIDEVKPIVSEDIIEGRISNNDWNKTTIALRTKFSQAQVKSYEYMYNGQLKSSSNINDTKVNYIYDLNNRLQSIKDMNGSVLSNYSYNYSDNIQKTYLNTPRIITQGKVCPVDSITDKTIDYDMAGGIYLSSISQTDADNKAYFLNIPKAIDVANEQCKCVRYGEYSTNNFGDAAYLTTANIIYKGDEIIIYHIRVTWSDAMMAMKDQFYYMYGNPIGKLTHNPAVLPSKLTSCEFIEEGSRNKEGTGPNIWVISVDTEGVIYARLKTYYVDSPPTENYLDITGDLVLSLK